MSELFLLKDGRFESYSPFHTRQCFTWTSFCRYLCVCLYNTYRFLDSNI